MFIRLCYASDCSISAVANHAVAQFNKEYIQQGIEGGKQAAAALRNIILEQCSELTDEIEIMAKVCTNLSGLSKALLRDGSIDNLDDFRDFTIGFTQGKASFEFIDVGHGKERADSKIRGIWVLRSDQFYQLANIRRNHALAPSKSQLQTNTLRHLARFRLRPVPRRSRYRRRSMPHNHNGGPSHCSRTRCHKSPDHEF